DGHHPDRIDVRKRRRLHLYEAIKMAVGLLHSFRRTKASLHKSSVHATGQILKSMIIGCNMHRQVILMNLSAPCHDGRYHRDSDTAADVSRKVDKARYLVVL